MRKRKILFAIFVFGVIAVGGMYLLIFLFQREKETKITEEEEEITEEIHKSLAEERKEKEQEGVTSPVEIIKHGWRILYRTVPKEGFMWEWAVEIENKTEIPLRVLIKYNLFDENGIITAEGIGGDELGAKERKIIIGRAVSEKGILNSKSSNVSVSVSPSRKVESEIVIEKWKWSDPYEISQ
jgi:hypothetical protein